MFISIFLLTALQPKRVKLTFTCNFVLYLPSPLAVHIKMFQNDDARLSLCSILKAL